MLSARSLGDRRAVEALSALSAAQAAALETAVTDAIRALGFEDAAYHWVISPNAELDGNTPLHFLLESELSATKVKYLLRTIQKRP